MAHQASIRVSAAARRRRNGSCTSDVAALPSNASMMPNRRGRSDSSPAVRGRADQELVQQRTVGIEGVVPGAVGARGHRVGIFQGGRDEFVLGLEVPVDRAGRPRGGLDDAGDASGVVEP